MKWLEMIHVRSSATNLEAVMASLVTEIKELGESTDAVEMLLLQHALYDGDLAAVIVWKGDRRPAKTREGLLLAERLQRLGTTDHAVWTAAPGFEENMNGKENGASCRKGNSR